MQVLDKAPSGWPCLVLNADYQPLSYWPLSVWSWQEAIKNVFLERVTVVSSYEDMIHSPSMAVPAPSVVALHEYVTHNRTPAFTRYNILRLLRARQGRGSDLRPCRAALEGRPHFLGKHCRRLLALQSAEGRAHAAPGRHARPAGLPPQHAPAAGARKALSAKIPARQLDGLSLLGFRTGALGRCRRPRPCSSTQSPRGSPPRSRVTIPDSRTRLSRPPRQRGPCARPLRHGIA